MDLKILVVVLPIIVFISIEASPIGGGGSGEKIGIRQSEGFQGGNNKSIKVKGEGKFLFEDGENDFPWMWITLGILCFIINCIMIIVCFKYCC